MIKPSQSDAAGSTGWLAYLPFVFLTMVVVALLGLVVFNPRRPLTGSDPSLPTARVVTTSPAGVAIPPTTVETPSQVPSPVPTDGAAIPVGFTPGAHDSTIAADTPHTFLNAAVWANGRQLCFVGVPYADANGRLQHARVWAACDALGITPPTPTPPPPPAPAPPAPAPPAVWSVPPPPVNTPASLTPLEPTPFGGCAHTNGGGRCDALPLPTMASGGWPGSEVQP